MRTTTDRVLRGDNLMDRTARSADRTAEPVRDTTRLEYVYEGLQTLETRLHSIKGSLENKLDYFTGFGDDSDTKSINPTAYGIVSKIENGSSEISDVVSDIENLIRVLSEI